jgi:hypothetical protein
MPEASPTTTTGASPTPTEPACVGDCNNEGRVTVDGIVTMVNIALGTADVTACPNGDRDGDGEVTIDEILAAVTNALEGCEI